MGFVTKYSLGNMGIFQIVVN